MNPQAYPLQWPTGWPRTRFKSESRFSFYKKPITIENARVSLCHQLELLGATSVVISTDLKLRQDGFPYSSQRTPDDQGVAVYFYRKERQQVIACDTYTRIADNIRAVAKTVEAMRGIERWGCSELLDRAFVGFEALPAATVTPTKRPWWEVLGVDSGAYPSEVRMSYRRLAREHHPDHGGSGERMAEINRALKEWGDTAL